MGHPIQNNSLMYGRDGRQALRQSIICPNCKESIYFTLDQIYKNEDLNCIECGKQYSISTDRIPNCDMMISIGQNQGMNIYLKEK